MLLSDRGGGGNLLLSINMELLFYCHLLFSHSTSSETYTGHCSRWNHGTDGSMARPRAPSLPANRSRLLLFQLLSRWVSKAPGPKRVPRVSAHGLGSPLRLSGEQMAHSTPLPPLSGQRGGHQRRREAMHSSHLLPPWDLATLPQEPSGTPHPCQHLEHHLRRAALLCSVRRRCPPRSPRSCGRCCPARSLSHSTSRRLPRPGGTLRRKHEGAPKFPAQERRSPSPPTLQAFLAVRQKLCFTESRHWSSHPPALSPGSPSPALTAAAKARRPREEPTGASLTPSRPILGLSSPAGSGSSPRRNGWRLLF